MAQKLSAQHYLDLAARGCDDTPRGKAKAATRLALYRLATEKNYLVEAGYKQRAWERYADRLDGAAEALGALFVYSDIDHLAVKVRNAARVACRISGQLY